MDELGSAFVLTLTAIMETQINPIPISKVEKECTSGQLETDNLKHASGDNTLQDRDKRDSEPSDKRNLKHLLKQRRHHPTFSDPIHRNTVNPSVLGQTRNALSQVYDLSPGAV